MIYKIILFVERNFNLSHIFPILFEGDFIYFEYVVTVDDIVRPQVPHNVVDFKQGAYLVVRGQLVVLRDELEGLDIGLLAHHRELSLDALEVADHGVYLGEKHDLPEGGYHLFLALALLVL